MELEFLLLTPYVQGDLLMSNMMELSGREMKDVQTTETTEYTPNARKQTCKIPKGHIVKKELL
jgi:hypothetical protein